jgi:hypothetical protein
MAHRTGAAPREATSPRKESTAFFLYKDSHEQFRSRLYPIAKGAYERFGTRAVVIVSTWRTFPPELQRCQGLIVHPLAAPPTGQRSPINGNPLKQLARRIARHIQEKKFWREQAISLLDQYNPDAIFVWKGYNDEVPWLVKYAKRRRIPVLFVGEMTTVFGFSHYTLLFRRRQAGTIASLTQGAPWYRRVLLRLGISLDPRLESLVYKALGVWDWKPNLVAMPGATHLSSNELIGRELGRLGFRSVIATGVPEQDELFELRQRYLDPAIAKADRNALGVADKEHLIVFALENFPALRSELPSERVQELIKDVLDACLRLPGVKVIVKVHPRDDLNNYDPIAQSYPEVSVTQSHDTSQLAALADGFLAHGTTAVSLAVSARRPAFIVDFLGHWICDAIHRAYGVPKVTTPEELQHRLALVFRGEPTHDSSERRIAASVVDGRAMERILASSGLR